MVNFKFLTFKVINFVLNNKMDGLVFDYISDEENKKNKKNFKSRKKNDESNDEFKINNESDESEESNEEFKINNESDESEESEESEESDEGFKVDESNIKLKECPCKNNSLRKQEMSGGNDIGEVNTSNLTNENEVNTSNLTNENEVKFVDGSRDIIARVGKKEKNNFCSIVVDTDDGVCFSSDFLNKLRKLMFDTLGQKFSDSKELIKQAMLYYHVKNPKKLLDIDDIKNMSDTYELKEQFDRFKPDGPWDESLLNNYNIDETVGQLELKYPLPKKKGGKIHGGTIDGTPEEKAKFDNSRFEGKIDTKISDSGKHFKHIPFMMNDLYNPFDNLNLMNFITEKGENNIIDNIKKGYNCFNVVFNTDESNGGGKHWYSVFLNFLTKGTPDDPWVIEHFNSSGMRPRATVLNWMKKLEITIEKELGKSVIIWWNDKEVQRDRFSCGVYSIIYPMARLEGKPRNWISDELYKSGPVSANNTQADKYMLMMRQYLFNCSTCG